MPVSASLRRHFTSLQRGANMHVRSSSLVTLARPSTSSSLRITDRSFQYASPRLWNQLPAPLRQPRTNLSNSASPSCMSGTSSIGSIDSPLTSSITTSLFHSRLNFTETSELVRFYFSTFSFAPRFSCRRCASAVYLLSSCVGLSVRGAWLGSDRSWRR